MSTIPEIPEAPRIVSLLPSATEIVCRLGLQDVLVGVTHECDYPPDVVGKPVLTASRINHARMTSAEIDHAVRRQLDGHGTIYDLDEVRLRELAPDLVLTQELCEVCAVSYRIVEQAARRLNRDTSSRNIMVVSLEPTTISDVLANIRTVGALTGTQATAGRVVEELRARLDVLERTTADLAHRPRTLVLEWLEPPFAPGHWVPEQLAYAGADASFGTPGASSRTTTAEEIRDYAPEIVVLAPCGFVIADTLRHLPRARLPAGWQDLPAVRSGNVWAVDASAYVSRPGPRLVDGSEILARIVHPQVFGRPEPAQAVRVPAELMDRHGGHPAGPG